MGISVLVTGASGLLGRAIITMLEMDPEVTIVKCAYSRSKEGYVKMNLLDFKNIEEVVQEYKPDIIIHSAAQRFPNKVEGEYEETQKLNIEATRKLAVEADKLGASVIYISTDYVFDGSSPPYSEESLPNPINKYGETKLLGEKAIMDVSQGNIVLRIPVLYGEVEYLDESAVTTLLSVVLKQDPQSVSDVEVRYPSHTLDVAYIIYQLVRQKIQNPSKISGIFHWCGHEALTKYGMVKIIGDVFGLKVDHVSPNREEPLVTSGPRRPKDAKLTTSRLDALGIGRHTPFADGMKEVLQNYVR